MQSVRMFESAIVGCSHKVICLRFYALRVFRRFVYNCCLLFFSIAVLIRVAPLTKYRCSLICGTARARRKQCRGIKALHFRCSDLVNTGDDGTWLEPGAGSGRCTIICSAHRRKSYRKSSCLNALMQVARPKATPDRQFGCLVGPADVTPHTKRRQVMEIVADDVDHAVTTGWEAVSGLDPHSHVTVCLEQSLCSLFETTPGDCSTISDQ